MVGGTAQIFELSDDFDADASTSYTGCPTGLF